MLYATVRRWYGPAAGLIAGAVLALTPVAVLMFRFNNPDALLVLLLVLGAYATVRAVETASTRWLVLVGVLVGFGFLTKMLQAFLVLPASRWSTCSPRRPASGGGSGSCCWPGWRLIVAAGWWVAIVELVPASARPYIGGSQNNSILELTLGYNGLGRITGDEAGSVGGGGRMGGGGGPFWADRLAADVRHRDRRPDLLAAAGRADPARRRPGADRPGGPYRPPRAGLLLWGGWLLVTGLIFSFMAGIFHAYYTVALAPAIGALVGIGAVLLWRERRALAAEPATPVTGTAVPAGPVAAPGGDAATAPGVDSATGRLSTARPRRLSTARPGRLSTPRPGRWPVVAGPSGGGGVRRRHPGRRPRGDRLVVLATARPQP